MPPIATSGSRAPARRVAAASHTVEADRIVAGRLRRGREHRTNREVRQSAPTAPRRAAPACASTGRRRRSGRRSAVTGGRRQIVLPHVDARRAGQPRDVGAIVHDDPARRAVPRARRSPAVCVEQQRSTAALRANLQQARAAVEARGRKVDERPSRARARVGVADDVEGRRNDMESMRRRDTKTRGDRRRA